MNETANRNPKTYGIIIDIGIMYDKPCVLFQYEDGYAHKYGDKVTDLGSVTEQRAIEMFRWNFGL